MYSYTVYQVLPNGSKEVLESGRGSEEEIEMIRMCSGVNDLSTAVRMDVCY